VPELKVELKGVRRRRAPLPLSALNEPDYMRGSGGRGYPSEAKRSTIQEHHPFRHGPRPRR
jgi:hypothetical protein